MRREREREGGGEEEEGMDSTAMGRDLGVFRKEKRAIFRW